MNFHFHFSYRSRFICYVSVLIIAAACNDSHSNIAAPIVVEKVEEIDKTVEDLIQETLKDILQNKKDLPDSLRIKNASALSAIYEKQEFHPLWSADGKILSHADSLLHFIDSSRLYGLFPSDYYQGKLAALKNQLLDTTKANNLDASKWARFDLLLSSGFVQMVNDLSRGRLQADSVLAKDSLLTPDYYLGQLSQFKEKPFASFSSALEPKHAAYDSLKMALRPFLKKADFKSYTRIQTKDSLLIPKLVYQRLSEEDSLHLADIKRPDSATVANAVKLYQKRKGLKKDGKITPELISRLNDTDRERFVRLAITLDRYKTLEPLPKLYAWVNIPSFYMQVKDSDTVVLKSKVVVGKPITKTPVLTSAISYMITYPRWTIPESIIQKEILPGLKRDPGYLSRKGYSLVTEAGDEINPYTVKWSKYTKGIPYKVVQGSGDENALGVMKFNFPNKYSVYLHDTNQRYLFSRSKRALSHGCVRVEAWKELALFLLRNDSIQTGQSLPVDSLQNWLVKKEKHAIAVKTKLPLYIRYFGCEVKNSKLLFYEDVYGEDKRLSNLFFYNK